ncbi:DUF2199 domain-containing protein [Brevundimonas sp.]|uniref:DUF2199 domain-containing protein n=1 Tax=Brevundimonas sp. TaxID=1871086 RepID=UPI002FC68C56
MSSSFTCPTCGLIHDGFPALVFQGPAAWDWATDEERKADWSLQSDFCRFKDIDFYVRCVLVLPIIDTEQTLEFGVWSTLSKANIDRYWDSFEDHDQSKLGPMFGWFSNELPGYPDTAGLKCHVLPRDHRQRPLIALEPIDHPLAIHQRDGITIEEATRYFHTHADST